MKINWAAHRQRWNPFKEGHLARAMGTPREANPYPEAQPIERRSWFEGWDR